MVRWGSYSLVFMALALAGLVVGCAFDATGLPGSEAGVPLVDPVPLADWPAPENKDVDGSVAREGGAAADSAATDKELVCHKGQTLEVDSPSITAHLDHGDTPGPCSPPL